MHLIICIRKIHGVNVIQLIAITRLLAKFVYIRVTDHIRATIYCRPYIFTRILLNIIALIASSFGRVWK